MPIDSETKRLKAELTESRAEVERLRLEVLHWMDLVDTVRRYTPPPLLIHQISEEMRQQMQQQMLTQAQCNQRQAMAAQNFYAQDGQYLSGLGNFSQAQQSSFGQGSVWDDCTCVPGRSALLRGETP